MVKSVLNRKRNTPMQKFERPLNTARLPSSEEIQRTVSLPQASEPLCDRFPVFLFRELPQESSLSQDATSSILYRSFYHQEGKEPLLLHVCVSYNPENNESLFILNTDTNQYIPKKSMFYTNLPEYLTSSINCRNSTSAG